MELKKNTQKDLENRKNLFFSVGLIIALSATLVAFEWGTPARERGMVDLPGTEVIEIPEVPRTFPEPPPPLDEAPQMQLITDIINISDDAPTNFNVVVDVDPSSFDLATYFTPSEPDEDPEVDEKPIPVAAMVDKPTFQGQEPNTFVAWVNKQIRYPAAAAEMNIQGAVYVSFVIGKTGELSNIEIIRSPDPLFSNEVIRVVKLSPKWEPGRVKGRPVNAIYNMPIRFTLQ